MRNHPQAWAVRALDILHHAQLYLAEQWRADLTHPEASANLQARALIWNTQHAILKEVGWHITPEQLNGKIQEAKCAKI